MTGDQVVIGPPSAAVEDTPAPQLQVPTEPVELRVRIGQEVLAGDDWLTRPGDDHGLGTWLWECWAPVLLERGGSRAFFDAVAVGHRRELWFWVLGERTWDHAIEGLAGRLLRRLPPS